MNELQTQARVLTPQRRYRENNENGFTSYGISVFRGETATKQELSEILQSFSSVFPTYTKEKMAMLVNMLYDEWFTRDRLVEAIKHVIRTCKYKEPTIADIVSFDRCVKLYTYSECLQMINRGIAAFDNAGGDLKVYNRNKQNGLPLLWYRESERSKAMGGR